MRINNLEKKQIRLNAALLALLSLLFAACSPGQNSSNSQTSSLSAISAALEMAEPEEVGMDSERLNRVTEALSLIHI